MTYQKDRFLDNTAQTASVALNTRKTEKTAHNSQDLTDATITAQSGKYHTVEMDNGQIFEGVVHTSGTEFAVGTRITIRHKKLSPIPQIIGNSGTSSSETEFLPVVVGYFGFVS